MKCRLIRIRSAHQNLRTNEVVGFCKHEPVEGKPFVMVGAALDPNLDARVVETTPILERTPSNEGKTIEFKTLNSDYKWEFLGFGN